MPSIHHPDLADVPLTAVLAALADTTRLEVVRRLATGEKCCADVDINTSKSALSHHMKVLRQAGIIHQRAEGTQRITSLRRADLERRFPGLLATVLGDAGPT